MYIDSSANMDITVRQLLWAKCINLGQTCIALDYVLYSKEVEGTLVDSLRSQIVEWYGHDPAEEYISVQNCQQ